MDATERLTLEDLIGGGLASSEHVHRYEVAAELCAGLRVADVGCGVGYGSNILRKACPAVTGIDNDEGAIRTAQETFGGDGLEFAVGDAVEFLQRPLHEHFDAIVMFETLEHLEDLATALSVLGRQAQAGIRLIVSVPNSRAFEEENPYHRSHFGYEEALAALEAFDDVVVLYQFHSEGSLIRTDEPGQSPPQAVLTNPGEDEYANHFIGCANFGGPEEISRTSIRMELSVAAYQNRYVLDLERANAELYRANARLGKAKVGIADSAAAGLFARVDELRDELQNARNELSEARRSEEWIRDLHDQISEQHRIITEMQSTRIWRLGATYWGARSRARKLVRRR
jgi:2-polyprenyl-3-methyl-5-hydroxy-6-metoxy-1,4-benzoquinol methylase